MLISNATDERDRADWQAFAESHPECGLYHHIAWRDVITRAYGHDARYLLARRDDRVTGILPLVLIRSRLFGTSLTSLPFVDYGGIVADDAESREGLLARAQELTEELRAKYLELRQVEPIEGEFQTATHKVLMTLDLAADEEAMWAQLSSERRNRVRRARKSGLSVENAGPSRLDTFYDIWTSNMRDLGSPPHSRAFFKEVLQQFGPHGAILLVRHEDQYIGAALAMHWKGCMSVPWVSSLREHFRLYPNNILYWEAMRIAISAGLSKFDFGRSTVGSGTFEFKQRWGAVAEPLHWQIVGRGRDDSVHVADAESYGLAVRIWKRIPIPITRWIGPALRKNISA